MFPYSGLDDPTLAQVKVLISPFAFASVVGFSPADIMLVKEFPQPTPQQQESDMVSSMKKKSIKMAPQNIPTWGGSLANNTELI